LESKWVGTDGHIEMKQTDDGDDFLRIYMNDHLAIGVGWRELARRAEKANPGTELGSALDRVATELAEDVSTVEGIMERLGLARDPVKPTLAVAGERLGRLKLNGRLRGYSPLSRYLELELLTVGIEGKKTLWAALRDFTSVAERLGDVDFDALIARAEGQRAALDPFRAEAGRDTFARN
jgi:hypothetical protein